MVEGMVRLSLIFCKSPNAMRRNAPVIAAPHPARTRQASVLLVNAFWRKAVLLVNAFWRKASGGPYTPSTEGMSDTRTRIQH